MKVSYYKNSFDLVGAEVSVWPILRGIGNCKWGNVIHNLRQLEKEQYDEAKRYLPCVTFSGTFQEGRLNNGLIEYSNLLILDIDHIEPVIILNLKVKFATNNDVYAAFTSPSGRGIKVLVKVDSGPERHEAAFDLMRIHFEVEYGMTLDPSGKNLARLCYVSSDRDLFLNENAVVHRIPSDYIPVVPNNKQHIRTPENFIGKAITRDVKEIYTLSKKWVERKYEYVQGHRNTYLYTLACTLNRCGVLGNDAAFLFSEFGDMEEAEKLNIINKAYKQRLNEHGTITVYDLEGSEPKEENYDFDNNRITIYNTLPQDIYEHTLKLLKCNVPNDYISTLVKGYIKANWAPSGEDLSQVPMYMNDAFKEYKKDKANEVLVLDDMLSMGNSIASFSNESFGVKMFLDGIDECFGGSLMPGNFHPIVGMDKTYKSILSICTACDNAKQGVGVLYCNGEMSKPQLFEKIIVKELGVDISQLRDRKDYKDILVKYAVQANAIFNNHLHIFNGSGFSKKSIMATCDAVFNKFKVKIGLIIIDGVSQMEQVKKEEIQNLIYQSEQCKLLAKEVNGGEGAVVLGLCHVSGGITKHERGTIRHARGGMKISANSDGAFCTSLLVDPIVNEMDNNDMVYKRDMFYLRADDKRGMGIEVSKIIKVHRPLQLECLDVNPNDYEVKIETRR